MIPVLFEKKELCCGCMACYSICPREAIDIRSDNEGFEYPVIIEEKCINCGACQRVCPIKKKLL